MSRKKLAWIFVGVGAALIALFTVASVLDARYGLQIVFALQGVGTFALLAVTALYAWLTRGLLQSQERHYAGVREQSDREGLLKVWEKMTPFSGLIGKLDGATGRFFKAAPASQADPARTEEIIGVATEIMEASRELLAALPALSSAWLPAAQKHTLLGTRAGLTAQQLCMVIKDERERAKAAGEPFSIVHAANAWERPEPDEDGIEYPRWADLRSGNYFKAVAAEQQDISFSLALSLQH